MTDDSLDGDTTMTAPLSPRAARSREKMLAAATTLLVESGPRHVTVDAVAEASGVAKSTLYRHWSSRDHLLIDVMRASMPAPQPPDATHGFEQALRTLLRSAAASFSVPEWPRVFSALTSLRTTMPELDAMIDADVANKKAALAAVLAVGIADGTLPETTDVDTAATILIGPLIFAALAAPRTGLPDGELANLADIIADHYLAAHASE